MGNIMEIQQKINLRKTGELYRIVLDLNDFKGKLHLFINA